MCSGQVYQRWPYLTLVEINYGSDPLYITSKQQPMRAAWFCFQKQVLS